jgi:hypothetical protein
MACKVVINCQLIINNVKASNQCNNLFESLKQEVELLGDEILVVLMFIDAIESILELKAIMLDPAVGEFLPGLLVEPLQQVQLLLLGDDLLDEVEAWNAVLGAVVGRAIGDGNKWLGVAVVLGGLG